MRSRASQGAVDRVIFPPDVEFKDEIMSQEISADRRHCLRHKVHTPAFASFDGVTGGVILDLSEEGLSMQTSEPLEAHHSIPLHLDLPDSATHLDTTGYIAWADALGRAGVRFSDLPDEARLRLRQWLTLNEEAPSRKAPTLSLSDSSWSRRDDGSTASPVRQPVSISLEPEAAAQQKQGLNLVSTTVQYEFNSLGADLNAALRLICERARVLTRGTGAAIALAHKDTIVCRASMGANVPPTGTPLEVGCGFSGQCVRSGKTLRCDDSENDMRVDAESCRQLGIRSLLAAPIRYERNVVGLLEVSSDASFAFDEGDVAVVERLAQTVLLAMSQGFSPNGFRSHKV